MIFNLGDQTGDEDMEKSAASRSSESWTSESSEPAFDDLADELRWTALRRP